MQYKMISLIEGAGTIVEFEAKLQMTDDKDFYHLHDNIIKKNNAKFIPVAQIIGCCLQMEPVSSHYCPNCCLETPLDTFLRLLYTKLLLLLVHTTARVCYLSYSPNPKSGIF